MLELGCDLGDAPCELVNLSLGAVVGELAAIHFQQVAGGGQRLADRRKGGAGGGGCQGREWEQGVPAGRLTPARSISLAQV